MKIAILSDLHHNPVDAPPKICSSAIPMLRQAIGFINQNPFDLVVELGDRIDDRQGRQEDLLLASDVAQQMKSITAKREHLMGNHDSYSLNSRDWEVLLERPVLSRAVVVRGFRVIFFSPDLDNGRGLRDYKLTSAELEWLASELARDERETIIFSHVPFMAGKMERHFYFENKPGRCEFSNSYEVRRIIEQTGNVSLVVSGHVHWNSWITCNGIHYVTVQSMTESFTTGGQPAGAYSTLSLDDRQIDLEVVGADPMRLVLPRRIGRSMWNKP